MLTKIKERIEVATKESFKTAKEKYGISEGDLIYVVDYFGNYNKTKITPDNISQILKYINEVYFLNEKDVLEKASILKSKYMAWLTYDIL